MARVVRTYVLDPETVAKLADLVAKLTKNLALSRGLGLLKPSVEELRTAEVVPILDAHGLTQSNIEELAKLLGYVRPKPSKLAWDAAFAPGKQVDLEELMQYAARQIDTQPLDLARAYVKQAVKDNRAALRAREQALLRKAMNPLSEPAEVDYSKSINNSRVLELLINMGAARIQEMEVATEKSKPSGNRRTSSHAAEAQVKPSLSSARSAATA